MDSPKVSTTEWFSTMVRRKGLMTAIQPKAMNVNGTTETAEVPAGEQPTQKKDDISMKDELVNAGILAGMSFFTSLYVANDTWIAVKTAGILAGITFFTRLATIRGLKPKE